MANLTPTRPTVLGSQYSPIAVQAGGDTWDAKPNEIYLVILNNASGTLLTATFDDPRVQSDGPEGNVAFNPDLQVTVTAGTSKVWVIQSSRFLNASTGRIAVSYSSATSISIEILGPVPRAN